MSDSVVQANQVNEVKGDDDTKGKGKAPQAVAQAMTSEDDDSSSDEEIEEVCMICAACYGFSLPGLPVQGESC
jgi:hypothetical protein